MIAACNQCSKMVFSVALEGVAQKLPILCLLAFNFKNLEGMLLVLP